jgi:hypothetical protein
MDEQPSYKRYLVDCMNDAFGTNHPRTYMFSDDELLALTPEHLHAYMCKYAFGTATPSVEDDPTFARSSTLEVAKKAISFYMPNRLMPWNSQTNSGNPTRSTQVNDLIKRIKKKEVRKEGKRSSARRAMNIEEFGALVERLRASEQGLKR